MKPHEYQEKMIGSRFGRLTVTAAHPTAPGRGRRWLCKCDCGRDCIKSTSKLNDASYTNKSCGCARSESVLRASQAASVARVKFAHPLKHALKVMRGNMIKRCHVTGTRRYERYGGRGIAVCQEWRENPTAFYEWAIANGFKHGLWIERKDVDGNYCPSNCCFKTPKEQANNTSRNHFLEYKGTRKTVAEWADSLGVKPQVLHHRIARGWTLEETLTTPLRTQ